MTENGAAYPPFSVFCKFLKREARIACNPVISSKILKEEECKREDLEKTGKSGRYQRRRNCLASGSSEVKEDTERRKREDKPKKEVCHLCKGLHNLDACEQFPKMSLSERMQFLRSRGLCHGCLKWGHLRRDCRHKKSCSTCNGPHPTLLHNDALKKDTPCTTQEIPEVTSHRVKASDSNEHSECFSHSLIVPVWLCHEDNPQDKQLIYALLDDQSDACFIKDTVLEKLSVNGPQVQLRLSTVLAEEVITCTRINGLVVQGLKEEASIPLPGAYSREDIPARRSQIPRPETARNWPHLAPIADQLMPYRDDIEVGYS